MSFDAPSLPQSLIPDYDPRPRTLAESDGAMESLVNPGLQRLWLPRPADSTDTASAAETLSYYYTKLFIDTSLSLLLILLLSPLFPLVAAIVRLGSPGSPIFRQRRLGRSGSSFWCYKFRTMVVDAEEQLKRKTELAAQFQGNFKIKNDPRVTRVGGFLRKTSLDELPQLFNVLRGDISLIGPRPIVEPERAKYGAYEAKLLSVKPGLSGLWQVYGRSDTTYEQRIQMDMWYIDNRSIWLDLKLIAITAYVVLRGRGAY
jgi:lipopolysaccharide/colanic/teichoic acid biosynthesis glycosyltransferase